MVLGCTDNRTPYSADSNIENTTSSIESFFAQLSNGFQQKRSENESQQMSFIVKYKSE